MIAATEEDSTRGFGLNDLDVVGILGDVVLGGGDAGAVLELDDAVGFEQQQGAGFHLRRLCAVNLRSVELKS